MMKNPMTMFLLLVLAMSCCITDATVWRFGQSTVLPDNGVERDQSKKKSVEKLKAEAEAVVSDETKAWFGMQKKRVEEQAEVLEKEAANAKKQLKRERVKLEKKQKEVMRKADKVKDKLQEEKDVQTSHFQKTKERWGKIWKEQFGDSEKE